MQKLALAALLCFATAAFGANWKNVVLVDKMCSSKVASNPDSHARDCAMQCSKSGYGIVTQDGKFLKFDKNGDEKALALLKSTDKKDHLRVSVDGNEKSDGTIDVKSVKLD